MKILIINQYFYPDIAATAQLLADLVEDLAEKDVNVTVLTSRSNYLGGRLGPKQNGRHFQAEVVRVRSSSFGRKILMGRMIDYCSFYFLILIKALMLPRHDIVLALTTPPLIAVVGLVLKLLRGSKLVCLVQDMYPDTAIELGFLKGTGWVARLIRLIQNKVYHNSERVIAISEDMRNRLHITGTPVAKIDILENWSDKNKLFPVTTEDNWFTKEHSLSDKFVIEYSGNMGMGHDFDTIIEAIRRLRKDQRIQFLFIGEGKRKAELKRRSGELHLDNVMFLPYQDESVLSFSIGAGHVSLISLRPNLRGCIVPCKLYGIMAAARPIIFIGAAKSDIAKVIREAECGFQVEVGDVDGLVQIIEKLNKDRQLGEQMGRKGHRYFVGRYERKLATKRYHELFLSIMAGQQQSQGVMSQSP